MSSYRISYAGLAGKYPFRRVGRVDAHPVEEEPGRLYRLPLTLTVRIHQLVERRCTLDLEKHFTVVLHPSGG